MKKTFLATFFLLIIIETALSQTIFREGYIIKKTGEHFTGLIEFSTNLRIPALCNFKRFDIATTISYSPQEIIEFGYFNGRRFKSVNFENEYLYFEILVSGQITLFTRGSKYFIEKDNKNFTEVENDKLQYNENGKLYDFEGPSEFLSYLTEGKVKGINDDLNQKTDLISIVTEYNVQSGLGNQIYKREISEKELNAEANKSEAYKVRIGVIGGVNSYSLKLTPVATTYTPNPQKETGLVTGITYENLITRKTDKLSLRGELIYLEQNFYCFKKTDQYNGLPIYDDTFFDFSAIKVPVLFQYSFTGRRVVPFINAGPAYMIFLKRNYVHTMEMLTSLNEVLTFEDKSMVMGKGELTGILGAGLRIRILNNLLLSLQGRFEVGKGIFIPRVESIQDFKQLSVQSSFLIGISL